ncbi:hypothetical protein KBZ19_06270 [Synechococcus sp. L2F]|uniref:hypothetical protein n=1 Tax=Synechococcus sp. L2F TaxID=2823739 RepID=UPI0020CBAD40|nr:hypothetical protein [Synechococcus sp. L2F]MCP9828090.1 hypothetical protein [Synechococcus sp. L2F]
MTVFLKAGTDTVGRLVGRLAGRGAVRWLWARAGAGSSGVSRQGAAAALATVEALWRIQPTGTVSGPKTSFRSG